MTQQSPTRAPHPNHLMPACVPRLRGRIADPAPGRRCWRSPRPAGPVPPHRYLRAIPTIPVGPAVAAAALPGAGPRNCRPCRTRRSRRAAPLADLCPAGAPPDDGCRRGVRNGPPRRNHPKCAGDYQRVARCRRWVEPSGRQFFAALATAGGQNGPSCAGPHPQPETMGLRATAVVRLEGALAHGYLSTVRTA